MISAQSRLPQHLYTRGLMYAVWTSYDFSISVTFEQFIANPTYYMRFATKRVLEI
jgi:hypothetical protein